MMPEQLSHSLGTPITTDSSDYAEILHELKCRLGRLEGKRVHDVGCGTGGALIAFKTLGMNASGSEPGIEGKLAAAKLGLNIANVGGERALQNHSGRFDAVVSLNVLGGSVNRKKRLEILDAAREKTDLQVHSLFNDSLGDRRDFLAEGWRTTFTPLAEIKTVVVIERIKPNKNQTEREVV